MPFFFFLIRGIDDALDQDSLNLVTVGCCSEIARPHQVPQPAGLTQVGLGQGIVSVFSLAQGQVEGQDNFFGIRGLGHILGHAEGKFDAFFHGRPQLLPSRLEVAAPYEHRRPS